MIRRTLMRRAYNAGKWKRARYYAFQIISKLKERDLARSVIIRSYWNEGDYSKVLELNELWEHQFNDLLERNSRSSRALVNGERQHTPKEKKWHLEQPSPRDNDFEFDEIEMLNNFCQEGNRLWMKHPNGWTFWDMPGEFRYEETHPDLFRLTAEILLYPWHTSSRQKLDGTRLLGSIPALSFSAGTDSTAAAMIMPENTILGYHRRTVESILDHRNAQTLLTRLENEGRQTLDIPSNHELIRTYYFKQIGFSTDFACATHLILLSDLYDVGAIAFGMPLDNTYLWKGRKYRDFKKIDYFQYWSKRFNSAGLDLVLPIAGISEAGCIRICQKSGISDSMNSCLRGDGKRGCGACWKCFHKNGPLGRPFNIKGREIQTFLHRSPLPTTTHALWALKELNLESETPHLQELLEQDLSWWTGIYPPSAEILPVRWKDEIQEHLSRYLEPMSKPYALESVNHYSE